MSMRSATLVRGDAASPGVVSAGDRRFRRPDVRPAGRRPISWWLWRAGTAAAALTIALLALIELHRFAVNSRALAVRHVNVTGNVRISSGEIDALIEELRGRNIFQIALN